MVIILQYPSVLNNFKWLGILWDFKAQSLHRKWCFVHIPFSSLEPLYHFLFVKSYPILLLIFPVEPSPYASKCSNVFLTPLLVGKAQAQLFVAIPFLIFYLRQAMGIVVRCLVGTFISHRQKLIYLRLQQLIIWKFYEKGHFFFCSHFVFLLDRLAASVHVRK